MSTQVATQSAPNVGGPRGTGRRGGNKGRGGPNQRGQHRSGGRGGKANGGDKPFSAQNAPEKDKETTTTTTAEAGPVAENKASDEDDTGDDAEICFICAEPVKYYSVSECNHRTCHVCALRLRALYKKTECTFCKDPQPSVIFTRSPDALFSSYTAESIPYKDAKLAISFETREMMEETLILLRFNCPDPDCDYIGNGWGDLKLHTRANHGKLMCDLCIRFKKVFSHEHALYQPNMLPHHLPTMMQRGSKSVPKEQVEGGVHPFCEFCRECFFSGDELYSHMRERHEECFICKRNEVRDQYFQNYESLERHFNTAHHPCRQSQCQAQKFVVFNTPLDLQAHMVEEHGADMSSRDKKNASRIQAEFQFEEVGGGRHHGRRGGGRDRERDGPAQQTPSGAAGPSRPAAAGSGARRREAFNASLTGDNAPQGGSAPANLVAPNRTPQPSRPPSPPRENVDPAVAERHAAFIARLQSFAPNAAAVPAVKAASRGYVANESSARDFISTIWNVLDQNLENTASIVNAFVDLLDEEEKKQDLLASWKGFAIEQRRQFPDLLPAAVGAGYAGITSGRVLNAKHATATRSSQQSSRQVWDRVAEAASSSSSTIFRPPPPRPAIKRKPQAPPPPPDSFPTLGNSSNVQPVGTTPFRQGQRNTPWSQNGGGFRPPEPKIQVVSSASLLTQSSSSGNGPRQPPPKLSNALFPGLPTSTNTRAKPPVSGNVSLRNILGNNAPASSAWQSGSGGDSGSAPAPTPAEASAETEQAQGTGKGKKGKGKQKQTLFTLGSFPT